ncbi:hypothetical protein GPLA_1207 [Paraglaciecola polaris LMG 21857]|uniref:Uncharacterized protein n=1 Tax=Paraglaciecola polaris LMG 21857 TaxID=1129793 RepID=K6ZPA5_9ALTE|nr:hypothetical protein GPLA_1207 [Paraglaciecola polaris LMG 21857]
MDILPSCPFYLGKNYLTVATLLPDTLFSITLKRCKSPLRVNIYSFNL